MARLTNGTKRYALLEKHTDAFHTRRGVRGTVRHGIAGVLGKVHSVFTPGLAALTDPGAVRVRAARAKAVDAARPRRERCSEMSRCRYEKLPRVWPHECIAEAAHNAVSRDCAAVPSLPAHRSGKCLNGGGNAEPDLADDRGHFAGCTVISAFATSDLGQGTLSLGVNPPNAGLSAVLPGSMVQPRR